MVKSHKLLPVQDEDSLVAAQVYVAEQAVGLAKHVVGQPMSVDTITIFAQSDAEYDFIRKQLESYGPVSALSHGVTTYVETDSVVDGNSVRLFGVRKPDPTRKEVGYGDFPVNNYDEIKQANIDSPNVAEIMSGGGVLLLELRHPAFDVRGYIIQR